MTKSYKLKHISWIRAIELYLHDYKRTDLYFKRRGDFTFKSSRERDLPIIENIDVFEFYLLEEVE